MRRRTRQGKGMGDADNRAGQSKGGRMNNAVSLVNLPICIFTRLDDYSSFKRIHADRPELWDGRRSGIIFEGVFYTQQVQ